MNQAEIRIAKYDGFLWIQYILAEVHDLIPHINVGDVPRLDQWGPRIRNRQHGERDRVEIARRGYVQPLQATNCTPNRRDNESSQRISLLGTLEAGRLDAEFRDGSRGISPPRSKAIRRCDSS